MATRRRIVRAFALGGASVIAMVMLLELVLRLFLASPFHMVRDDHLGLRGRPDAIVIQSREGYSRNRLNHEGMADHEPDPNASERILVVGDSYTEALNVPLQENLTSVAEFLLPGAEVINGGVSGRSPVQSVAAARE